MNSKIKFFLLLLSISLSCTNKSKNYNLNFEEININGQPVGWNHSIGIQNSKYLIQLDSNTYQGGKYSIKFTNKSDSSSDYGVTTKRILAPKYGNKLKLSGYIKSKNILNGYAGLFLRIEDNEGKVIGFRNMYESGIKGTNDWKEYSIELPFDAEAAEYIFLGGYLDGKGEMWMDNLKLTINNKSINKLKVNYLYKAELDTSYRFNSNIKSANLNIFKIKQLTNLGMLWGFLKYYHPAIAKGDYQWDAEFFRIIHKLTNSNNTEFYIILEKWVDSLGKVPNCKDCSILSKKNIKSLPDFGYLFKKNNLPTTLLSKLELIRDNYKIPKQHYYIEIGNKGNPLFLHELKYNSTIYPDAGIRLLSLFNYWNKIKYYYPYRYLIDENWNKILSKYIPLFIDSQDKNEYILACLGLIASLNDGHANIGGYNPTLDSIKGTLITPFKAKFLEDKLVVTGFYRKTNDKKNILRVGDIIEEIDGSPINILVSKFLHLTPASNYEAKLLKLSSTNGFLLRSNKRLVTILIKRGNLSKKVPLSMVPITTAFKEEKNSLQKNNQGFKLLSPDIGYIYPARLGVQDIYFIKRLFKNTKGLIIDLRCYPTVFMPFTYGEWLKHKSSAFATLTNATLLRPGTTVYTDTISNGPGSSNSNIYGRVIKDHYSGKIILLVNSETQSQAEYTAMALSTASGAIVLGSKTAGADGDVSDIYLPGNIQTKISGIGVYYPDASETQRIGIKIDILKEPTVNGITEGRDELLEAAINIVINN